MFFWNLITYSRGCWGLFVDYFHINYKKASSKTLPDLLIAKHDYLVTSDSQFLLCYGVWIKRIVLLLRMSVQVKGSAERSFNNTIQIRGVTVGHHNSNNYKTANEGCLQKCELSTSTSRDQKFFEFNMIILIQGMSLAQAAVAQGMSQGLQGIHTQHGMRAAKSAHRKWGQGGVVPCPYLFFSKEHWRLTSESHSLLTLCNKCVVYVVCMY